MDEARRALLVDDMEKRLDLHIVDARAETEIRDVKLSGTGAIAECYIKTYFNYVDADDIENPNAPIDLSAFGIEHTLTFEKNSDDTYVLVSDEYDEGPLTNMRSSTYTDKASLEPIVLDEEAKPEIPNRRQVIKNKFRLFNPLMYYLDDVIKPDYNLAIAQADSWWTSHYGKTLWFYKNDGVAYSNKYALNYNPAFKNFNASGGDCANFVSQCMDAATRQAARDDRFKPYTSAWISSTNSIKYWAQTDACIMPLNSNSQISFGPIYYDWDGKGNYKVFYHAAFAVGTDSSGRGIVNSHNKDYYHIRWNYGGSNCKYANIPLAG